MSFSLEFTAKNGHDAALIIDEETNLPQSVRAFLLKAVAAWPDQAVMVKAVGHLWQPGNYMTSNAEIRVTAAAAHRTPRPIVTVETVETALLGCPGGTSTAQGPVGSNG